MLYRHRQGTFEVCPFKAIYFVNGDTLTTELRYIEDKEIFENILNTHEKYAELKYEEVILTDEQKSRYEQIRHLSESSIEDCINYVRDGVFPEGNNHALRHVQLEQENVRLGQELSDREINEIIQGIQLSDLEIQLLMLMMGEN